MSTEKPDTSKAAAVHKDAEGQFARGKETSDNNGVSSAKPRVITGTDDATSQRPAGQDWKIHRDEDEANEGEFHG